MIQTERLLMLRTVAMTTTLALVSCFAAASANAAPWTFVYTGSIVSVTDPTGLLPSAIQVGMSFTGDYAIDPDLADDLFVLANGGTLYFNSNGNKLGGHTLNFAGEYLLNAIAAVQVGDNEINVPLDLVDVLGVGGFTPPARQQPLDLRVSFFDTSATRLSDDDLFVNQTLDGWTNATLRIVQLDSTGQETELAVGEIALVSAVPGLSGPLAFGALFVMLAVVGAMSMVPRLV
jgi:hypothetical protein